MKQTYESYLAGLQLLQALGFLDKSIDPETEARKSYPFDDVTPMDRFTMEFTLIHYDNSDYEATGVIKDCEDDIHTFRLIGINTNSKRSVTVTETRLLGFCERTEEEFQRVFSDQVTMILGDINSGVVF